MFSNSGGSTTTKAAKLTVDTVPVVTTNPASQTVNAGLAVTLVAAATGTPVPTVGWQVSTNGGTTYTTVPGATSTTYAFTAATAQSGELFRAVFSNGVGTATTAAAKLTVYAPPAITINPSSISVNAGQSASFTAGATGSPTPTLVWQVSTNGGTTYTTIAGATSSTYSIITASAQSGYLYRAVFTNAGGTATTTAAKLLVDSIPVVTTNPSSLTATAGQTATLTAAATGTPAPSVVWQVSTNGVTYTTIPGATSASYSFTATLPSQASISVPSLPMPSVQRPQPPPSCLLISPPQ